MFCFVLSSARTPGLAMEMEPSSAPLDDLKAYVKQIVKDDPDCNKRVYFACRMLCVGFAFIFVQI